MLAVCTGKIQSKGSQVKSYVTEKSQQDERQSQGNIKCMAECFVKYIWIHPYTTAKGKSANSEDVHVCAHGTELILMWWDTPCSDKGSLAPGPQCTPT